jgi:hypothetical protein
MADSVKEKRLALNDYRAARHSLARVLRMRFRNEIDSATFRDMVYGLHCLLGFDKLQKETELEKRLTELENRRGGQSEVILMNPDQQDKRILELLEKAGYTQAETPQAEVIPDPIPAIPDLPEQPQPERPQPRRLKL